jgi:Family of unknown function (DUF6465)
MAPLTSKKKTTESKTASAEVTLESKLVSDKSNNLEEGIKTKSTAKKPAVTKTAKAKSTNIKTSLVLQYESIEVDSETLITKVKKKWATTHQKEEIKTIDLYIKPTEYSVYYVINNSVKGRIDL